MELFTFNLDDEDRALLDACAAAEKLTRSDVLRRLLRAHASKLGVSMGKTKPKRATTTRKK